MPLYKSLVRSRLEYCVQAWRPYLVKDIELVEKVQKRMTRMLPDLKNVISRETYTPPIRPRLMALYKCALID